MSSDFDFEGKIRTLQISDLRPAALARVFKLDEESLVLTDENKRCYMPDEDRFEPLLSHGHKYKVDGIELSGTSSVEISENRIAVRNMASGLCAIQGNNRDELVLDVIESCKDLNESANMLYHGPQAVVLVQSLAILAVCAPDPSLDVSTLNKDKVKRLADPGSFRASLLHVANNMCNAFRQADKSMKKIRARLIDLPEYFNATLEVVGQNDDVRAQKILERTVRQIEEAATLCRSEADIAKSTFDDVIEDIDALSVAATSSKTVNEREKEKLKKEKESLEITKSYLKDQENELKEAFEAAKSQNKQALQEYREQMDKSVNLGKLFLATLADGVMDVVKAGASLSKIILNPTIPIDEQGTIKTSNTMKYAMENAIIACLDKIATSLSNPTELDESTISNYITSLETFEKYAPMTKEGKDLFKMAKEVKDFVIQNKTALKDAKDLPKMRASIQNLVVSSVTAREERQHNDEKNFAATTSMREQIIRSDTERVHTAREHLTAAEKKEELRRKEFSENQAEITKIICQLKNIDTTSMELTEIIKYLRMGVEYLGKIKKNWVVLAEFFSNIKIIIDINLSKNVENFVTEAKDPVSRQLMLRAALKATGYCIQVSNAADIYTAVSGQYIMPIISGIGEQLSLTKSEARQKQKEIDRNLTNMNSGVQQMIEDKQSQFKERVQQQMQHYAHNMIKAVKVGNIAAAKATKH